MAKRKTVNGIRLIAPVDESTRSQIRRAGNIVAQVKEAERLGLIDKKHYERIVKAFKVFSLISYAICYVGLCRIFVMIL